MVLSTRFEFATASRILFGAGAARQIVPEVARTGSRVLVVGGRSMDRVASTMDALRKAGLAVEGFPVGGEPTVETARSGAERARMHRADLVIGMGGGSVLDAAKAIAALTTNTADVFEYLEVIGRGAPLEVDPIPVIAVPTTAGTGSEVTRNAVLSSEEHRLKVSLRHPRMLPVLAIVDPELTYSLPPSLTASTGLDALTQLIEPFVSTAANPLTDGLCREGLHRAARSLERAATAGDPGSREDMAVASLFGGLALANAKLGAVHGLAGPIGGMFPRAPHGAVCGRLLPFVLKRNVTALHEQEIPGGALARFDELGRILTGDVNASIDEGLAWLKELCDGLGLPGLASYGVDPQQLEETARKALASSSMKGNPVGLTVGDLVGVLEEAM